MKNMKPYEKRAKHAACDVTNSRLLMRVYECARKIMFTINFEGLCLQNGKTFFQFNIRQ